MATERTGMRFEEQSHGTTRNILMFQDHYVAFGYRLQRNSSLAIDENGRKVVKAGTLFPANDDTAVGVVMNDYDVTYGDQHAAIICHGFIQTSKIPAAPTPTAEAALKMVQFFPLKSSLLSLRSTIATGDEATEEAPLIVTARIAGTRFKASVALSDLTISVGDTALTAEDIEYVDQGRAVRLSFTGTAEPGIIEVVAKASALVNTKASNIAEYTVN